ncbi:oligosaccharide flippase family protein [Pseudomonas sp. GM60]|uniref:oligosaccharide flippase family protein n=1 Tax=Pseudomonas sp. GM60 TaxID=1144334 RepID=UPI0002709630|nr:oligosaccharide flippase family protein [Pseudomonas sp. GM60]EJM82756.1 membrane protein involved in the export of O-antigen and teichoic acid [Pseudomonas sp. GM60]
MYSVLRGFFIYGMGEFLSRVIAFGCFLFLASALVKQDYGLIETYVVAIALLCIVCSSGLSNALQAFYYSREEFAEVSEAVRLSTGLTVFLIWQVFAFAVLSLVYFFLGQDYPVNIFILAFFIASMLGFTQLIQDIFRLRFQPFRYLMASLFSKGIAAIVSLAFVMAGFGVEGYLYGYALALFFVVAALSYWLRGVLFKGFNSDLARKMLRYGIPFIFVGFGSWVFSSLDRWMLASMVGLDSVGDYAFSVRISFLVGFLSLAFGQAWAPLVFKLKESRPSDYASIYGEVLLVFTLLMSLLAAGVSVFSGDFVHMFFSEKYGDVVPGIFILSFACVVQSTTSFTAIGISLSRKTYYFAWMTWGVALFSFILNLYLIPKYYFFGAIISNFCSIFILTVCYFVFSQKLSPMKFRLIDVLCAGGLVVTLFGFSALFVFQMSDLWLGKVLFLFCALLLVAAFSIRVGRRYVHIA